MINIKKGNGLTLQQADKVFPTTDSIIAGQAVSLLSTGAVQRSADGANNYVIGVALNNYNDGDVVDSGKIGVLLFESGSVIETDQLLAAPTAGWLTPGLPVYAYGADSITNAATSAGKFTTDPTTGNVLVGRLLGTRTLPIAEPSVAAVSQTWVNAAGTSITTSAVKPGFQSATFAEIQIGVGATNYIAA